MTILITGVSGMLGHRLYMTLKDAGFKVYGTSRTKNPLIKEEDFISGDITNKEFLIKLKSFSPDIIIHSAAITNIEFCENNKFEAWKVNVESTLLLTSVFDKTKLIYISTDSVYDGMLGNYSEEDATNPLNYYATTKVLSENIVKKLHSTFYILRTNIYGFNNPIKKSLLEWVITNYKSGIKLNGYENVFFNPLYTGQLALIINCLIISTIPSGIYNVASNTFMSKYFFIEKIFNKFGYDKSLLSGIRYNENQLIKRPLNTTLNINKIKRYIDIKYFQFDNGIDLTFEDLKKIKYDKYK